MRPGSDRWQVVSESAFPHEAEGLAHVRDLLPDRGPYHAWTNFEFRDGQGKWHEVDLLVAGERRLHLLELKHYRGEITGNAYRWVRGARSEDSPLILTRRKAQRLKSVLVDAARDLDPRLAAAVPYLQECVLLHARDTRCLLAAGDRTDLFGLDGHERSSGLPSIRDRLLEPRVGGAPTLPEGDLLRIVERAGFAVRRQREVGSWRLLAGSQAEGEGWQDWPAEHRFTGSRARVRFYVSNPGASQAERRGRLHFAQREFALTNRLQHVGVLSPDDFVETELGPGLVFPVDDDPRRLDLWLADAHDRLSIRTRVDVVRQLAEAVDYAHGNHVVHRALNPTAVHVVQARDGDVTVRVSDWAVAGQTGEPGSSTPGADTRILGLLDQRNRSRDERVADAYVAPEGQWIAGADRVKLDVFALGALAYHVVAGREPAGSGTELKQRVAHDDGLDLVADLPEVPGTLRRLVLEATRPRVSQRLRDLSAFLERLSAVDRELGGDASTVTDPLDAPPGTLLGDRFELVRRLGSGSTAVGLLVTDRSADGDLRVLKVALDDTAARRLTDEAEVLATLNRRRHPRLVRLAEEQPLRVGERTALLLESAGEESLADVLRDRPRLSLDLLERWGTDLLEALVALDEAGIDHRDVKPANLGVREQRSDRAKHLVLFDFSLAKAGAASIRAGTPPYLDPFLGSGTRTGWDSAAERYAAAVTLFEMATGHPPAYGDGRSDPAAIDDEATVEPGDFDASLATGLVDFFRTALARDARKRHDTPGDMLAVWRATVSGATTTVPDDADVLADRATAATPLVEAGLSARALSALEPFHLETVGDLVGLDRGRLSRLKGAAHVTSSEIRGRAKQWRARFADGGGAAAGTETGADVGVEVRIEASGEVSTGVLADPELTAMSLATTAGPKARARRQAAVLLGLEGEAPAFGTLAELAPWLGVGGQPQTSIALAHVRDAWAEDEHARATLDLVAEQVSRALADLDGAAWAETLVGTLVDTAVTLPATAARTRVVAGLVRAALDRGDDLAKGAEEQPLLVRRRRRTDNRVLLAETTELADAAVSLGQAADRLVDRATELGEVVVPVGRAAQRLRRHWPATRPVPDDARLVRVAARLSEAAAASTAGELYSVAMTPLDAIRLAVRVGGGEPLAPDDIRHRVQVRFPGIPDVPGRPRLDALLTEAGTGLVWTERGYVVESVHSETTFATRGRGTAIPTGPLRSVDDMPEVGRLRSSVSGRSFLALGVPAPRLRRRAGELVRGFGAQEVDVTGVLLRALRAEAGRRGVPWDQVRAADAAAADSTPGRGLAELVRRCVPEVEQAVRDAMAAAPEGTRPVLLTEAAPLARYRQLAVLARLADITTRKDQAVWLLLPLEQDRTATLDGASLTLSYDSQFLTLEADLVAASENVTEGAAR